MNILNFVDIWGNSKFPKETLQNNFSVNFVEIYHKIWKEIHTKVNPTEKWFNDIIQSLPPECGCGEKFKIFLASNPPDFNNWLEWSVKAHNWVNRKLDKVEYGLLDAMSLILGNDDIDQFVQLIEPTILCHIPPPEKSRAILVLACDEKTQAEFKHTRARMEVYAQIHGLDFVVIHKISKQTHKCGNKYAYSQIAHLWEQTLWLDTDVIVNPTAPNIFDLVPPGSWGLVDDLAVMENTDWFTQEFRMCQRYWGVEETRLPKAWNSGVVVAPRNARDCYYPPPMRVPNVWCAEQHWHTQALVQHNANVVTLPDTWNNGFPWKQWYKNLPTSYFNHVNGCHPQELRVEVIAELAAGKTKLSDEVLGKIMNSWRPSWLE